MLNGRIFPQLTDAVYKLAEAFLFEQQGNLTCNVLHCKTASVTITLFSSASRGTFLSVEVASTKLHMFFSIF